MSYISITGMLKELGKSKTKLNANVLRYYFRDHLESINGGCFVYYDMFLNQKSKIRMEWDIVNNDMHAQMITDLIMDKPESANNFDIRLVELEADNKILQAKNAELEFRLEKAEKAISNIIEIFYNVNKLKGE